MTHASWRGLEGRPQHRTGLPMARVVDVTETPA
jgi:hypothetical protein